jgi:phage terminase small subunit
MRLPNARHELFCQRIAAGLPASRAYMSAGYTARGNAAEANASRLLRDAKVKARIDELLSQSAKEMAITKERLTLMLLEDRALAHAKGQAAAALAITVSIGKLHGFAFDPIRQGVQVPASTPKPEGKVVDFAAVLERLTAPDHRN